MLRRFGFELARGLEVGDQGQMDVQAVLAANVEGELANRFEKRKPFDIADRAADFGDDHVDVVGGQPLDRRLDLVGHMRDHLHGPAFVVRSFPLLLDHREVDLACGVVAFPGEWGVGEAFVMAKVQIGLGAVVQDVNLSMLVRAHRSWVDVNVGVELLESNPQASAFEQHADRGACEPLAQRTDHSARYKDVLGH